MVRCTSVGLDSAAPRKKGANEDEPHTRSGRRPARHCSGSGHGSTHKDGGTTSRTSIGAMRSAGGLIAVRQKVAELCMTAQIHSDDTKPPQISGTAPAYMNVHVPHGRRAGDKRPTRYIRSITCTDRLVHLVNDGALTSSWLSHSH